MTKKSDNLGNISNWLLIIGGLNAGLVALSPAWNVINLVLGSVAILERSLYLLIGIAAVYVLYNTVKK